MAVLSFFLGTGLPFIYQRFSHDGFAIGQPADVRAFTQSDEQKTDRLITFGTLIKVANAQGNTLLLENILVHPLNADGVRFNPVGVDARVVDSDEISFPIQPRLTNPSDQLPLLVPAGTAKLVLLALWWHYDRVVADAQSSLRNIIERDGLAVSFAINGKNRPYTLLAKPFPRYSRWSADDEADAGMKNQ